MRIKRFAVYILIAVLAALPLQAQIFSSVNAINLSLTVPETLTLACTPATITFTYSSSSNGTGTASGPITCTTSWNLAATKTQINLQAYLTSTTAALTNGTVNIAAVDVFASTNGGAAVPCTGPASTKIPTFSLPTQCAWFNPDNPFTLSGSHSDTILMSMASLGVLPAGIYTGVLNIEAESE